MTAKTARQDAPLSSVSRATSLKAAIYKAMAVIGYKNGTAPPSKEEDLHLLYVFNEVRSYFDKLYKSQLEAVIKAHELDSVIEKSPLGESVSLIEEPYYALVVKRTTPSSKVDLDKFITSLRRRGVTADVIDAARSSATVENKPPRRFEVVVK